MIDESKIKQFLRTKYIKCLNEDSGGSVYKYFRNGTPYLFKIYNEYFNYMREVTTKQILIRKGFPTPAIIDFGKYNDNYFIIQDWWHGTMLLELYNSLSNCIKKSIMNEVGEVLGRLNTSVQECELEKTNLWKYIDGNIIKYQNYSWKNIYLFQIPKWINKINFRATDPKAKILDSLNIVKTKLENLDDNLPIAILHRDYGFRNIMIKNNHVLGVIDFEYATIGDPVFDLSKLLFNDLNYERDIELSNIFINSWKSKVKKFDINRLKLYMAIQGGGAIQWVDKQSPKIQNLNQNYREKGMKILLKMAKEL